MPSIYRLGKRPPIHDARTLQFRDYTANLPAIPTSADFLSDVPSWPMYSNDTLGDCVAAAAGHMIENWTQYAGKFFQPTDQDIIDFYTNSGYVPGDPSTDQGWELLPALKVFRKTGIAGHKIAAFVQLATGDYSELQRAIALFGDAYIGLALPDDVVPSNGGPDWTAIPWVLTDNPPNPANGHCVPVMKYSNEKNRAWFISWAARMVLSPPFYSKYSDEAYAIVTEDWIEANGESPSGFDIAQLTADLDGVVNWSRAGWEKRTGKKIGNGNGNGSAD
jgi:hypothetical protein